MIDKKEAMRKRLKDYRDGNWDDVNSVIAEYSSLFDEKEIDFQTAIKEIIKRLGKFAS